MSSADKPQSTSMRVDKWLWCARFYKTRSQATAAIRAGRIKLNGSRIKPGKELRCQDQLEISLNGYRFDISVEALAKTRGSASSAAGLFQEDAQSKTARLELQQQKKLANQAIANDGRRPDKRQRRKIIAFTRKSAE